MNINRSQINTSLGKIYNPKRTFLRVVGRKFEEFGDDNQIDKLIKKSDRKDKMAKLLKSQLLLLPSERDPALMRKLGLESTDELKVDNYPPYIKDVSFIIHAFYPSDKAIDSAQKAGYQILGKFVDSADDSVYFFYFPKHIDAATDGYIIDGNLAEIDSTGKYTKGDGRDYNVYKALYDVINKTENYINAVNYFEKTGNLVDGGINYKLKKMGFKVNYQIKNHGNSFLEKYENEAANTKKEGEYADLSNTTSNAVNKLSEAYDDEADLANALKALKIGEYGDPKPVKGPEIVDSSTQTESPEIVDSSTQTEDITAKKADKINNSEIIGDVALDGRDITDLFDKETAKFLSKYYSGYAMNFYNIDLPENKKALHPYFYFDDFGKDGKGFDVIYVDKTTLTGNHQPYKSTSKDIFAKNLLIFNKNVLAGLTDDDRFDGITPANNVTRLKTFLNMPVNKTSFASTKVRRINKK